jgi:hypothetical protein
LNCFPGLASNCILLISASQEAGITEVSQQHPATFLFLRVIFTIPNKVCLKGKIFTEVYMSRTLKEQSPCSQKTLCSKAFYFLTLCVCVCVYVVLGFELRALACPSPFLHF